MATKSPIECPVCREPMVQGRTLERHLVREHRKRELAKRIAVETESKVLGDCSE